MTIRFLRRWRDGLARNMPLRKSAAASNGCAIFTARCGKNCVDAAFSCPISTPSGKIELFSRTIARFGYANCPGHPAWLPLTQQPDRQHSLWLIANQPATRLHSQLDFGRWRDREICQIHPQDALKRAIRSGDIVKIFNKRGALLACAKVTEDIMPGVIQVPTGAWFDPLEPLADAPFCVHGNPNVVTLDAGTSSLAQGGTGQIATVEMVKYEGVLPPVKAFIPPRLTTAIKPPPAILRARFNYPAG